MTGYGTAEASLSGQRHRIELKSVNHRFLDLKVRLPRELQAYDALVRAAIQARFARGSVELKLERVGGETGAASNRIQLNLPRAREAHAALESLRSSLGISEPVTLRDISQFPEVISMQDSLEIPAQDEAEKFQQFWKTQLEPLVIAGADKLETMRAHEGASLARIMLDGMAKLEAQLASIRDKRIKSEAEMKARIDERVRRVFEAHPLATANVQSVLESRIAQELALLIDRTDIQEELDRFAGHIQHFRKTLAEGQQLGRKLEFLLQELGREINTLGNKAQDIGISEQVVAAKVRLEQLREQVLNLA
jgi:uncharacterized protein (TIGR00255 family)